MDCCFEFEATCVSSQLCSLVPWHGAGLTVLPIFLRSLASDFGYTFGARRDDCTYPFGYYFGVRAFIIQQQRFELKQIFESEQNKKQISGFLYLTTDFLHFPFRFVLFIFCEFSFMFLLVSFIFLHYPFIFLSFSYLFLNVPSFPIYGTNALS